MEFWTAFFASLPATIIALTGLITIILSHWKQSAKLDVQTAKLDAQNQIADARDLKLTQVAADVKTIEKATNSLTDRLVESTDKEAFLRGKNVGQNEPRPPNADTGK